MKLENIHKQVLEYLDKHGAVNTYRLSKDLEIDRVKLIKMVEKLKDNALVEFKSGTVLPLKVPRKQKQKELKILKEFALKILSNVNLTHNFYLCNGTILKNLSDLLKAFETINDETYQYHANNEKDDFGNWIKEVIGDEELASNLKRKNKEDAIKILKNRVNYFKKEIV